MLWFKENISDFAGLWEPDLIEKSCSVSKKENLGLATSINNNFPKRLFVLCQSMAPELLSNGVLLLSLKWRFPSWTQALVPPMTTTNWLLPHQLPLLPTKLSIGPLNLTDSELSKSSVVSETNRISLSPFFVWVRKKPIFDMKSLHMLSLSRFYATEVWTGRW